MDDTTCDRCGELNLTDGPVCTTCQPQVAFCHRPNCECQQCGMARVARIVRQGTLKIELPLAA